MFTQKIKATLIILTSLFVLNTGLYAQKKSNFYIYLCFGQSNMEGQGTIEPQDTKTNKRFRMFQAVDCPDLFRIKGKWYTAEPPTCQCHTKLSPADYFGKTMIANLPDSITVGIINVAVGGSDIRLFDKDIYQNYDSTYTESWFTNKVQAYGMNPYKHLIDLAKLAQNDGVIKGILLHQGESNTGQEEWVNYVKKIYENMLSDLSLNSASVPLIAGEVLSTGDNCCSRMNTIINQLPSVVTTAKVVSSAQCEGEDNAHFNSEGYRILGKRYATEILKLMGYSVIK